MNAACMRNNPHTLYARLPIYTVSLYVIQAA